MWEVGLSNDEPPEYGSGHENQKAHRDDNRQQQIGNRVYFLEHDYVILLNKLVLFFFF